jgi:fructuronate reductase
MVKAVVAIQKIFGTDLIDEARFIKTTTQWLASFYAKGVFNSIKEHFSN